MKKIIFICTLLVSLFAMSGCSDDIDTPVLTRPLAGQAGGWHVG